MRLRRERETELGGSPPRALERPHATLAEIDPAQVALAHEDVGSEADALHAGQCRAYGVTSVRRHAPYGTRRDYWARPLRRVLRERFGSGGGMPGGEAPPCDGRRSAHPTRRL
jgi:hypothetical protein